MPLLPTKFDSSLYKKEFDESDFFYSPDGIGCFPEHHCKMTWLKAIPFLSSPEKVAIDIGSRDGEFTRYLSSYYSHVYCFEPRKRPFFQNNVDLNKVTLYNCCLGDGADNLRIGNPVGVKNPLFYKLDQFKIKNVGCIKIDTDGFERAVISGGLKTIKKNWPILILEVYFERETLKYCTDVLGYKVVDICERGWDHILIKS